MDDAKYPIPEKLNLAIAAAQLAALLGILWAAGRAQSAGSVLVLAIAYGLVMNSGYAMLHEAEHGLLHGNRVLNDAVGTVLALFFPAPFHLIRQGHIGLATIEGIHAFVEFGCGFQFARVEEIFWLNDCTCEIRSRLITYTW